MACTAKKRTSSACAATTSRLDACHYLSGEYRTRSIPPPRMASPTLPGSAGPDCCARRARHDNVPAVYNRRLGLEIWTVNDGFTFATMLRVPFGRFGAHLGGVAQVNPKLTFGFRIRAFHSHGARDFVLDAKFSARKQFGVRYPPVDRAPPCTPSHPRDGGPERVVAQTVVAAAWF